MEVGGEVDYTYRYTVTIRMIPALRWAAMRAIFSVTLIVRDKVRITQLLKIKESRSGFEPMSLCLPA